jgi:hypothetical protein
MVALLIVLLRRVMTPQPIAEARRQAGRELVGGMQGHTAMDMLVTGEESTFSQI